MKSLKYWAAAAAIAVAPGVAQAGPVTLDTGLVQMGVGDNGGLGRAGVGLVGYSGDAITPGCLCEGWGAAASGASAYTYGFGDSGIVSAVMSSTTPTGPGLDGLSVVELTNGLRVTHKYTSEAAGRLFGVEVTMENISGADVTDVRYARTLDWDVPPGHFSDDFTTVYRGPFNLPSGNLFSTSTNPFAVPDPMVTRSLDQDANVVDAPGDLGSFFIFRFGDLAAGGAVRFNTYIGVGRDVKDLLDAFGDVGVEVYSYTFDNDGPATYGYGFANVGLPPAVPEPAGLAMLGVGLVGVALRLRRK